MKIAILIPTYNEAKNIERLIPAIIDQVPQATIIVIDDNSPDGTATLVEKMMINYSQLRLKKRSGKLGLASAYLDTIKELLQTYDFDIFLTIDADLSHNPIYIPVMIDKIRNNDVVIGSRYTSGGKIENWPKRRLFVSYFGNLYQRSILCVPVKDMTSGFMMMRAEFLKKMDFKKIDATGYTFLMQLKFYFYQMKARICEVPITFTDRTQGDSKINMKLLKELIVPWQISFNRKYYQS